MSDDLATAAPTGPRTARARAATLLALAVAVAVALLLILQLAVVRPALEAELGSRSAAALRDAGYGGVSVDVAGRDVTASGTVTGGQATEDVAAALAEVPGVRRVAVSDVQLLTAPLPADDGVVTAAAPLDAVDLETTAPAPAEPASDGEPVESTEGSRLLTAGFQNASQSADLPALTFVDGSPTLTADSDAALQAVADQVIADTTGRVFVIRTHTDSVGDSAYNQWLSERRAMVVCNELLALGVPEERLTITGVGESEPLVSPEVTDADRATNRRVEIVPNA